MKVVIKTNSEPLIIVDMIDFELNEHQTRSRIEIELQLCFAAIYGLAMNDFEIVFGGES